MKLALQFAVRYFFSRKSTNAINILSWISVGAIVVGTAALIIVLSVFNGFEGLIKSLYSNFYPEVIVQPREGKRFKLNELQWKQVKQLDGISVLSRTLTENALLRHMEANQTIVVLKGVDEEYNKISDVEQHIDQGQYLLRHGQESYGVFGVGVAASLGVRGDQGVLPVSVYVPGKTLSSMNPEEAFSSGLIYPSGVFAIQQEFDNNYVLTDLEFVQSLLDAGDDISALEIKLVSPQDEERVIGGLQKIMGPAFKIENRFQQNKSLYLVMQTEKWAVYAILAFILVIAGFNMIGTLGMLVLDKQKDIAVLKAMGATPAFIHKIFLAEGAFIAVMGGVAGLVLGSLILWLQKQFGIIKLDGSSFVVEAYPVAFNLPDYLLVACTVVCIGMIAAWFPARKAARLELELRTMLQ